ncbi:WecB/TagA/CpsF family glycosyltransferase (plasmid) [Coraliomargarita sp. W4R53]
MSRPSVIVTPQVPPLRLPTRRPAEPIASPSGGALADLRVLTIGGSIVHLCDERAARRVIAGAVRADDQPPLAVASINLDHIHHFPDGKISGRSPDVRWLDLIDGSPIAHQAHRLSGLDFPRLAGSDIVNGILTDLAAAGLAVAVIGGSDEASEPLRQRLAKDWPGLRFAGHWTPPREVLNSTEGSLAICAEIKASGADVLLVCLGKPRQEKWIADYATDTGANVLLAFGAVVDFLAGRVTRAPRWVSKAGVEWMWRLMLEPRRLARRYLIEGPPAYVAVRRSRTSPKRA